MVLAAFLFCAAGVLNGVYPGGEGLASHGGYGWLTYVFGLLNLGVAYWIWRGSERGLVTRIALAAVFLAIVAALALAEPTAVSLVIYVVTGLIEVVILVDAIRVWRLGRGADRRDLEDILSLAAPLRVDAAPQGSFVAMPERAEVPSAAPVLSARLTWLLGILSLAFATALAADGILSGFVPGASVQWGFSGKESGWLVYLFALVVLVIAVRAVHASILALRLLVITSLLVLVERAFSPFAMGDATVGTLLSHLVAALLALATALASVVALRSLGRRGSDTTRVAFSSATTGD